MSKYKEERRISKQEGDKIKILPFWREYIHSETGEMTLHRNDETGEILIDNYGDGDYFFTELNPQPEPKMFYFSPLNYSREVYVIANSESEAEKLLEKEGIKAIYTFRSGT